MQHQAERGTAHSPLAVVGQPLGRVEGVAKVTGQARYAADRLLPGQLWAKCLRSPLPHARIVAIDTSGALRVPGVRAVLTAADLPPALLGNKMRDMPLLARERVRFVGERGVLSVGWDGTVRTWEDGRQRSAYALEVGRLCCLAVAPDGMTAAAGGETGTVVVWDLEE